MKRGNQESRVVDGSSGSWKSKESGQSWDSESSRSSGLGVTGSSSKPTPPPAIRQRWPIDREEPSDDSRDSNVAHTDTSHSESLPDHHRHRLQGHKSPPDPTGGRDSGYVTTAEGGPPLDSQQVRCDNLVSSRNAGDTVSRYANPSARKLATSERPKWPEANVIVPAPTHKQRLGTNGMSAPPVRERESEVASQSFCALNADRSHSVRPNDILSPPDQRRWPLIRDRDTPDADCSVRTGSQSQDSQVSVEQEVYLGAMGIENEDHENRDELPGMAF